MPSDENAPPRLHLLGVDRTAMHHWLTAAGQPGYRADQLLQWIYEKQVDSFEQMTNLPRVLRTWLTEHANIGRAQVAAMAVSQDGTRKLLLRWPDGAVVETVWIPEADRHTACLSSQVGCPVGCRFCASGLDGVERNLTTGEIVEQAWRIARLVAEEAAAGRLSATARLSHIVLMGSGEPLANYDAVLAAIRILNAPWGLGIGARRITLSTVGLPQQIRRLAKEGLQLNLALSLHAADPELRRALIPWGKVPLNDLLSACEEYFRQTGREVTLEYVLLEGVNTRLQDAVKLAAVARRLRANVNLLRYNPVPGLPYQRPSAETAWRFQQELQRRSVNAHIRTSRGSDVEAACGQLRRRTMAPPSEVPPAERHA